MPHRKYKVDWRSLCMNTLKFVCREDELSYAKDAINSNNFVVYYYFDNSGLSYYLKKLQTDLCKEGDVCFYIDCAREKNVAIQIAEQIVAGCNQTELKNYVRDKKETTKHIVQSLVASINIIPFFSIGEIVHGFMEAIDETIDVDIEHISDYKIEKAIINVFQKYEKKNEIKKICLLIDDTSRLSPISVEFIAKVMEHSFSRILFTIPRNYDMKGIEALSKLSYIESSPYKIEKIFTRPNNRLICGLFNCYNKKYKEEYLDVFERYERNIHVIMSYINGFNMDFLQFDSKTLYVLKILILLKTHVHINILNCILDNSNFFIDAFDYSTIMQNLKNLGFIEVDINNNIHLNKKIVNETEVQISLVERITITHEIIGVFEIYKSELTIPQLKFAIHNLNKDYSRRKSYILLLLKKQRLEGEVEQEYLDMLFYLDNKQELLEICSMYYNLQVYDVPLIRIKQHTQFSSDNDCQILVALLRERLHEGDYSKALWELTVNSKNIDEQCLLLAVLFTALFNEGRNKDSKKILCDSEYTLYYKNFSQSSNYHYLVRNISYYIDDVKEGIYNYNYCLSKFKNVDPVNYNRTMSNFLGYLMKHDGNEYARIILDEKIEEVKKILEFNDPKYLYLNINYGIYLMREDKGDPTKYFESIIFEAGTTETPYIYARINQALYVAKKDSAKALLMLDEIFYQSIRNTSVVPTKIFYQINRILVEYMNGINNRDLLDEIKLNPLRGDIKYAEKLFSYYTRKFNRKQKYEEKDWKKLFLPGYIFYHGFDAKLLLSTFESPSFTI